MTQPREPFLPVAAAEFGRKTRTDLCALPEEPFELLTRAEKAARRTRSAAGATLELDYVRVLGVRLP